MSDDKKVFRDTSEAIPVIGDSVYIGHERREGIVTKVDTSSPLPVRVLFRCGFESSYKLESCSVLRPTTAAGTLDAEGTQVVLDAVRNPPEPTQALRDLMARPRRQSAPHACELCGSPVRVAQGGEGTAHYEPVTATEPDGWRALEELRAELTHLRQKVVEQERALAEREGLLYAALPHVPAELRASIREALGEFPEAPPDRPIEAKLTEAEARDLLAEGARLQDKMRPMVDAMQGVGTCEDVPTDRTNDATESPDDEGRTWLELPMFPNDHVDDQGITCIFCRNEASPEYALLVKRDDERALVGIHEKCVAPLRRRNRRSGQATESRAALLDRLDDIATRLADKLATFRHPWPNQGQVRGLIFAHLEEATRCVDYPLREPPVGDHEHEKAVLRRRVSELDWQRDEVNIAKVRLLGSDHRPETARQDELAMLRAVAEAARAFKADYVNPSDDSGARLRTFNALNAALAALEHENEKARPR